MGLNTLREYNDPNKCTTIDSSLAYAVTSMSLVTGKDKSL